MDEPNYHTLAEAAEPVDLLSESTELRDRLESNTRFLREKMPGLGFSIVLGEHPIVPVMLGDTSLASRMADASPQRGVYVIGFSFPVVPVGKARIRIQVSAAHTAEDLEFAATQFAAVKQEL